MSKESEVKGTGRISIHEPMPPTVRLARTASIEMNVGDLKQLRAAGAYLPFGMRVHVTHLPKQTLEDTERVCLALTRAGFQPIPHIAARAISSERAIDRFLERLTTSECVEEILLIAGDYSEPCGPYSCAMDVMRSGLLSRRGLRRVSFAGHPEGHPKVDLQIIRRAEREKVAYAREQSLEPTLISQFFFEPEPFLGWVRELRGRGVEARVVAGLAGPAPVTALLKYAVRCGVGPSLRALGVRSGAIRRLVQDHGPERVMAELAEAQTSVDSAFDGFHFFCFGGFRQTCEWLHRMARVDLALSACSSTHT